jgi:hypothetical protein
MGDKSRAMREFGGGGRGGFGFGFGGKKEGFDEEESSSSFSSSSSESSGEEDVEEEEEEEKEGNFKENAKPSTGKRGKFAFFSSGLEEMTRRKGGGGREDDDDDDDDIEDDDDDIEDDIDDDEILEVREYNTHREHQQQWQNQKPPPPLLPNANTSTNNNNNKNKEWRKLLPHYVPASELFLGSRVNNEVVFVDYQAQFNSNGKRKTQVPMTIGEREAYDAQMQNPFNTSKNNNGANNQQEARWYTTGAGVRTYVTKTGQKLTGKRAYDASIKDQQKWGL